ncbi:hypothetical protein ZIOFF_065363 [Zingiber officinale]|uniref:J domain-containing protein n=1 Tax=Zingiber officinale TaxID=94328 RepID=A0A8J5EZZ3_ZINOF|nr:hypothetical protein ZIOFF_065363 [Zingiber officinale]
MDCNREDAKRAMELAEIKFKANDVEGAKRIAQKACDMFGDLPGIRRAVAAYEVHLAAAQKNWHSVLRLRPGEDDEHKVREQFLKMSILTHPDKNSSSAADGAFKFVMEAWNRLSIKATRSKSTSKNSNAKDDDNNNRRKRRPTRVASARKKQQEEEETNKSSKTNNKRQEEEDTNKSSKTNKKRQEEEETNKSRNRDDVCPQCVDGCCKFLDKERTIKRCETCKLIVLLARDLNFKLKVEGRGTVKLVWEKLRIGVQSANKVNLNNAVHEEDELTYELVDKHDEENYVVEADKFEKDDFYYAALEEEEKLIFKHFEDDYLNTINFYASDIDNDLNETLLHVMRISSDIN